MCGRRPIGKYSRKSPRRISPRGPDDFCDDAVLPLICPTCQLFSSRQQIAENAMKRLRQIETSLANHLA
jgi:hypothetical protein